MEQRRIDFSKIVDSLNLSRFQNGMYALISYNLLLLCWSNHCCSLYLLQVKRVGKYEIGRTLGEGTFGKVKYAVNTETGEKVRVLFQVVFLPVMIWEFTPAD